MATSCQEDRCEQCSPANTIRPSTAHILLSCLARPSSVHLPAQPRLVGHPVQSDRHTVQDMAKEKGHAWHTVERAKTALGVVSIKQGSEGWAWHMPPR